MLPVLLFSFKVVIFAMIIVWLIDTRSLLRSKAGKIKVFLFCDNVKI